MFIEEWEISPLYGELSTEGGLQLEFRSTLLSYFVAALGIAKRDLDQNIVRQMKTEHDFSSSQLTYLFPHESNPRFSHQ